jgi:hypothetical protein
MAGVQTCIGEVKKYDNLLRYLQIFKSTERNEYRAIICVQGENESMVLKDLRHLDAT